VKVIGISDNNIDKSVSVIVPVKNGASKIESCLKAILDQTYRPKEIILVDGHSTDGTVEIARKFPVKIIFENYHTIGGARQVGVYEAKGRYIAFTDADCLPSRTWLESLIKEFTSGIVGVGGGTKNIGNGLWGSSIAFSLDTFLGSANSVQDRMFKERRFVKGISGCNSIYKKSDILKVNGFNVKLSINEDTELNKRLIDLGKFIYTPDAIVFHNQDRGIYDFAKRMYSFGYGRGINRLWDLQIIPPIVGLFTLIILFFNLKAFFILISIYIIVVLIYSLKISLRAKSFKYSFSVPAAFLIEHISYSVGFWIGLFQSLKGGM
jgi:glycosyltransferase involved in cell wall biosynthesis